MTTTEPRRLRLAAVLGLREGAQQRSHEALTALHKLAQHAGGYVGHRRTYKPDKVDDQGQPLDKADTKPDDLKKVELNAEQVVRDMAGAVSRFYDLQLTMDEADTQARSDVVIELPDGGTQTILRAVPVTTLMFLEKRLKTDIQTFLRKLPVQDPSRDWTQSPSADVGIYQTPTTETVSTKKTKRWEEIAPATREHKAQVISWDEDLRSGIWETVNYTGALPPRRYGELLERLDLLLNAVRTARERANQVEVERRQCGDAIMNFILNG